MTKFRAGMIKEVILLVRDIPGLILLFLLPLFLVLVVTLTQEKALRKIDQTHISVVFIDNDTSSLGKTIEEGLLASQFFHILKSKGKKTLDIETARKLIHKGDYQIGIFIPKGATDSANSNAYQLINKSFASEDLDVDSLIAGVKRIPVIIYLDPAINESYRNSVVSSLKMLLQAAEIKIMLENFIAVLNLQIDNQLKTKVEKELALQMQDMQDEFTREIKKRMGAYLPPDFSMQPPKDKTQNIAANLDVKVTDRNFPWQAENILEIREEYASPEESFVKPSVIQNNVPAFTLFAMFFIIIPLSGSIIIERNEGAFNRLRTLPVNMLTVLSGKITIYLAVCILQFLLLLLIGMKFFPLLGLPGLVLGSHSFALVVAAIASSLAAIGFGLLIGTIARTHGQAAMFGSVMVVILSILGGVFIPVYLMPDAMKLISNISPIRWGIDTFLFIFVRQGDTAAILTEVIKLTGFFAIALAVSLNSFTRRN
jgi:ABC-2 type transport system permease protein